MAADEEIARGVRELGSSGAVLRLYGWRQPAISLGRRQKEEDLPPGLLRMGLPMVRRPTGGGAVLHRLDEQTYAVAVSREALASLPLRLNQVPGLLHRRLRDLLVREGHLPPEELRIVQTEADGPSSLCFSFPVSGDLVYRDRKVAGSALRAWREGLLIQGSIQGLPVNGAVLAEMLKCAVARSFGEEGRESSAEGEI